MDRPWLSVVMPTYNGAAHLPAALDSIAGQADPAIEVIAVDDGSTDSTLGILGDYAERLALTTVRRPHAGNWVAGTNHGLGLARGDWVCFLHQDDRWAPDRLAALREAVARWPGVDLLLTATRFIDERGRPLGRWRCPLPARTVLEPRQILEPLLVQNFVSVPAPVFRRAAAQRVGGLDETLWYTADWDFWLKLAAAGPAVYVAQPLVELRVHRRSQTVVRSHQAAAFRQQLDVVLDRHLRTWEAAHPTNSSLRRVARFAVEVNATLAAAYHGQRPGWAGLSRRFLTLGPAGWRRFLRDSRIAERVIARLRAGLAAPNGRGGPTEAAP